MQHRQSVCRSSRSTRRPTRWRRCGSPGAWAIPLVAIALVMLWSQIAHAGHPSPLAQALDTADLFQEEYRQDLATAVADAEKQVAAAAPGTARALALTLKARFHRLRAEYRDADRCLDRAEREPAVDGETRVRILVERRWNELDRFRTPWGSFNPASDDTACVRPDLVHAHLNGPRVIQTAINAIEPTDPVQRQTAMARATALVASSRRPRKPSSPTSSGSRSRAVCVRPSTTTTTTAARTPTMRA